MYIEADMDTWLKMLLNVWEQLRQHLDSSKKKEILAKLQRIIGDIQTCAAATVTCAAARICVPALRLNPRKGKNRPLKTEILVYILLWRGGGGGGTGSRFRFPGKYRIF